MRCSWAESHPLLLDYHDHEWGVPVHDERKLFEFLVLEGMQAGLSWLTILQKREAYLQAFDHFRPELIAGYGDEKRNQLLSNTGIIRNRIKIDSVIKNARALLAFQDKGLNFHDFIWQFTDGESIDGKRTNINTIPASDALSVKMSKELKKAGFSFVGPVVCYSFMQAVGMINDHVIDCFRHNQVKGEIGKGRRPADVSLWRTRQK